MGKYCELCVSVQCQNKQVHFSTKAADVAYCNVVRASRHAEDSKADVQAGRPLDELDYGTLDMDEGEAKEAAKAEGVALAARFAEKREARQTLLWRTVEAGLWPPGSTAGAGVDDITAGVVNITLANPPPTVCLASNQLSWAQQARE